MPPQSKKRAAAPPPPPSSSKEAAKAKQASTPRQSALAKEHGISAATEIEIKEAFNLFASSSSSSSSKNKSLPAPSLRRALTALGVPPSSPSELKELLDAAVMDDLDDDDEEMEDRQGSGQGTISYAHFVAVAALKLNARSVDSQDQEVDDAFELFLAQGGGGRAVGTTTKGGAGGKAAAAGGERKGERVITMETLRRVTVLLKEEDNVGEEVLRDMLLEANGGQGVGKGVGRREFEGVMRRAGVFR